MPISEARLGLGTLLYVSNANNPATETLFPIAELTNISFSFSGDAVDVTSHDDVDRWKTYIQGSKTVEVSIEGNLLLTHSTHRNTANYGMLWLFDNGIARHYYIEPPVENPTINSWAFTAIITSMTHNFPTDTQISFSSTLTVTGKFYFRGGDYVQPI